MKKIIALLLALCMVLSVCSFALADEAGLKDARSYINLMYKNKPASTPKDYELVGSIPGENETYTVEWSTDSDTITVTREESGMVKIDVNEDNPKVVEYKLTATIKDAAGNEVSISFDRFVPAAINLDIMTEEEIVEVAYGLEDGATLPALTALTGTIVAIPSAYSEQYDNITVNIQVGDLADKPIQCYRLVGGSGMEVGDQITVVGTIKNYKGTIEFDKGCYTIDPSFAQSVRVAAYVYTLEEGASMSRESTITGVITAIPTAYSPDYGNITVNIDVPGLEGYTIQCYRLTGGEDLFEGEEITVTGTIKNYKGTIEFDKGCTYEKGELAETVVSTDLQTALDNLATQIETQGENVDLNGLLNELLGSLGVEGENIDLNGILESLKGENGEGIDLNGMLSNILGDQFNGEVDLNSILGGENGEGIGLNGMLNGLFSNENGEAIDLNGMLNGLFSTEEGAEGTTIDFGSLLNGIFGE